MDINAYIPDRAGHEPVEAILSSTRRAKKVAAIVGAAAAYACAYPLLHQALGTATGMLAMLPVVLAALLFGWRVGILAATLSFPLISLLVIVVSETEWHEWILREGAMGSIMLMVVGGVTGMLRDLRATAVSELLLRKRAEEALQENEELYRTVVENATDAILIKSSEKLVFVNKGFLELYGLKDGAVLTGQPYDHFILPEDREMVKRRSSIRRRGGPAIFEYRIRRADGEVRAVQTANATIAYKGQPASMNILRDISRLKRAEEVAWQQANENIERVKELNCLYELSRLIQQRSLSLEEILQRCCNLLPLALQYPEIACARILIGDQEFKTENFRETAWKQTAGIELNGEQCGSVEVCYLKEKPDSDEGPFLKEEESLINAVAKQLGETIVRKRAEEEREALIAELEARNEEMSRFNYTASHDLRSPLITIKGFLGLLEQDAAAGNGERMQDDITRIANAANRMSRLLDELLEFSRIGRLAAKPEEVPLGELAREAVELVAGQISERGVQVTVDTGLPVVYGDRSRLLEVLQNLIDNAVKFMGDEPNPRIEIGARKDGEDTACFVRDNGIGINPRYHDKVFQLFDKLDQKSRGTGVGLAIVKRVIEAHRGRTWVESEGIGHGSTIFFTIPRRVGKVT